MQQTQSKHSRLPRRLQPGEQVTTLRSVRQDKPRPARERVASPQPAPPKTTARARSLNTNPPRTKKHSTTRKTVHGTIWMPPSLKADLQRIAEQEGLSFSQTGKV